jgi:long-subunit acyl-CoA synthetase (AMP-forming)
MDRYMATTTSGRNIMMGYLANPELGTDHVAEIGRKTGEAIDSEGWLHSGDKGCMDSEGMFRITGRRSPLFLGSFLARRAGAPAP